MGLLAGTTYDPATAVSKSTAALLAMTALDTTNLRLAFTAPANGRVMVRLNGTMTPGSASPWYPLIHLGVLEAAVVKGRMMPNGYPLGLVPVASIGPAVGVEALFTVGQLVAGNSYTWDAAYGVEVIAAGSAMKYGGPNNTTTNDAWGAFVFEIYDTA